MNATHWKRRADAQRGNALVTRLGAYRELRPVDLDRDGPVAVAASDRNAATGLWILFEQEKYF